MAVVEILAYSPMNNMNALIDFFINGRPDGQGGFETDSRGRMKVGVLRWLHGRQVSEAHFADTPNDHPMKLLMSLVDRPEQREVPWMDFVAGIEEEVRVDGLIGNLSSFTPIDALLDAVVPNQQIDDAFRDGRAKVQEVLARIEADPAILSVSRAEFLRTLKSERGTNPKAVFAEVQAKLNITL